ncbi:type IV secretion protein Rhs [Flavobacterium collinsii]|nr:type IV secretion protein Rhs [Flavobacterium collinsii]
MKKYIYITLLILLKTVTAESQVFSDDNFIYTLAPKKAVQSADLNSLAKDQKSQTVQYVDGLGRPVQTIAIGQGGNGEDMITPVVYDAFGRQVKEYLPYPVSNAGNDYPRIDGNTAVGTSGTFYNGFYNSGSNSFSEKKLENSPLNRLLKQAAPGTSWEMGSGHEIKMEYLTNTENDEVRLFKAVAAWSDDYQLYGVSFSDAGHYAENQLYKTVTYDENTTASPAEGSGSTVEFKNKEGQVVLKRTYDGDKHDTYYVYDDYGNLTYVIPPKADGTIDMDVLNGLCYQYKYDGRNRLAEKKLPGKQWEFIVYDKLDRPVATGPAVSPFKGESTIGWIITKYDALGRPIYTGWKNQTCNSAVRTSLQNDQNNASVLFETKQASGTIDGIEAYYSNLTAPTEFKLLTVNYYDNYTFPNAQTIPSSVENQTVLQNVKGMATGSWTRALSTASSTAGETSTIFYDDKARPIKNYLLNYLGGYTSSESRLDFTGKMLYTVTKHKRTSGIAEITVREEFTYSEQDRLLTHTHQINGGAVELLAENKYDALGQLESKKVGGSVQKVDYKYNIRGWLKEINNVSDLEQDTDPVDLFAFKINYDTAETQISDVKELYNGNIAETFWKTASDLNERAYGYKYDKLNRLKNAVYEKNGITTSAYDENLTYDKNGNIKTLGRKGDYDPQVGTIDIDDLEYTYPANSNQLAKVADNSNNVSGFNDANKTGDDYSYDDNGNLTADKNKNITEITYNHLNLPKKITFGSTGSIEYIYTAAGQKIEKIVTEGTVTTVTNYLGGYQYKDNVLEFFPTAEGYVKNENNALSYVYQYKDHLGNVRLSYARNTQNVLEIIEENNYYPFGLKHKGYNDYLPTANKYKYNGKELQDESIGGNQLNLYDYGARNYDPALGRWMNIDPLAEEGRRWSPYNYAMDNPIYFTDPDGMLSESFMKKIMNSESGTTWTNNDNGTFTSSTTGETTSDGENHEGSQDEIDPKKKKQEAPDPQSPEEQAKYHQDIVNLSKLFDYDALVTAVEIVLMRGGMRERTPRTIRPVYRPRPKTNSNTADPFELEMTHPINKSKNAMSKLKTDIKENGMQEPIKVVEYKGRKYVVDGHHRLRAAKELGLKNVPIQKVNLPYGNYKTSYDLFH